MTIRRLHNLLTPICRYSIAVSTSACHADGAGSIPATCSRVNLARLSAMRNPLSLLKLGVYSKPNLVKDFVLQKRIRVGSSPTIYAPRSPHDEARIRIGMARTLSTDSSCILTDASRCRANTIVPRTCPELANRN